MAHETAYFDYAAATPMHKEVVAAMTPYFIEQFYNPSATYQAGQNVRRSLNEAKSAIAQVVGVKSSEIIFTAGGTEANNLAVSGVLNASPSSHGLATAIEHDSILEPLKQFKHDLVGVDRQGRLKTDELAAQITDTTTFISVGLVNNEIGTIQDLKAVRKIVDDTMSKRQKTGNTQPLYFHTDACQAGNYLALQAKKLGVDLMTVNGGKLYGPKQSGALYVRAGIRLNPLLRGGGQEQGMRSGTENVAAAVGLAKAMQLASENRQENTFAMVKLHEYFTAQLKANIQGVQINGSLKHRIANNVHISVPGIDNERVMMMLDEQGVICAVGSACSASKEEPSHVLKSIGMTDKQARESLRFSMGAATSAAMIDRAVNTLKNAVAA